MLADHSSTKHDKKSLSKYLLSVIMKRHNILPALILFYVIFNVVAIYSGAWNTTLAASYVAIIASIVPSFNGIAAISKEPEVAAFVLATFWGFIPIGYLTLLCVAKWRDLDRNRYKIAQPISLFILLIMFFSLLMWVLLFLIPDPSLGRYNRFLFTGIKYFHTFLLLYCTVMWLVMSALLFTITSQLYLYYRNIRNKLEVAK